MTMKNDIYDREFTKFFADLLDNTTVRVGQGLNEFAILTQVTQLAQNYGTAYDGVCYSNKTFTFTLGDVDVFYVDIKTTDINGHDWCVELREVVSYILQQTSDKIILQSGLGFLKYVGNPI